MMRWGEFVDSLPDGEALALVNALTLACGRASWAVRLMAHDAPADDVLAAWSDAATALIRARRLLAGLPLEPSHQAAPSHVAPPLPPTTPWRSALMQQGSFTTTLLALLTSAVTDTRAAAEVALADGEVDAIRLRVVGAVAALADVRHLLGSVS